LSATFTENPEMNSHRTLTSFVTKEIFAMVRSKFSLLMIPILTVLVALGGCSSETESPDTFVVGAIPDQNVSQLNRRFEEFSDYLESETDLDVEYNRSNDYAALVTAFRRGEVHLGWFGGLTGVQARRAVPGSQALAQRPRDEEFHSKFIVRRDLDVNSLEDLRGQTFTFGDENSTSGHLMPRHFLLEAGVDPSDDFQAPPNFSGSHDRTWKLVESGSYQAGALNEAVWNRAVRENQVDTSQVRVFYTTPAYYDYHWTLHADVNDSFGEGTSQSIQEALLKLDPEKPRHKRILDLFAADGFIETKNENYQAIEDVAKRVGIIK
jgi:phosphonate transport system substrate-binding protein